MRHSTLTLAAAGLVGAFVGISGTLLVATPEAPAAGMRQEMALKPPPVGKRSSSPPSSKGDGDGKGDGKGKDDGGGGGAATAGAAGATTGNRKDAAAAELESWRATAQGAQKQLGQARRRIAALEKELERAAPEGEQRARHEFDLTREDWRQLAANGNMKYRLPCSGGAASAPSDDVLDELGLAPEDREVLRQAFEHSLERQRNAILPLCATALGGRMDMATALSVDSCRHIILSTAASRSENESTAARSVATYMAGDGPPPNDSGSLSEKVFLASAEESKHFEDELADAFGPDEAHRLVFSNRLCFSQSSHRYASRDTSKPEAAGAPTP
jgi:hypothetical protein